MNKNGIAAVGDKDSVLAFKAVGMEVRSVSDVFEASTQLKKLIKEGFRIIFVTEQFAVEMAELIERYKPMTYPAIIPIPGSMGSNGYGLANMQKDIEKAIGTNLLLD